MIFDLKFDLKIDFDLKELAQKYHKTMFWIPYHLHIFNVVEYEPETAIIFIDHQTSGLWDIILTISQV